MAQHHGRRRPGARIRRRAAAGTRRRRAEPGHRAEAALVDGVAGVGGGRYFNYRPPLGFCGPFDPTCAAEIRQGRGLTWSFPVSSGAWRQDGERRSSAAPTLLQDAGSAGAAASFGRRRGGASSYEEDRLCSIFILTVSCADTPACSSIRGRHRDATARSPWLRWDDCCLGRRQPRSLWR